MTSHSIRVVGDRRDMCVTNISLLTILAHPSRPAPHEKQYTSDSCGLSLMILENKPGYTPEPRNRHNPGKPARTTRPSPPSRPIHHQQPPHRTRQQTPHHTLSTTMMRTTARCPTKPGQQQTPKYRHHNSSH